MKTINGIVRVIGAIKEGDYWIEDVCLDYAGEFESVAEAEKWGREAIERNRVKGERWAERFEITREP